MSLPFAKSGTRAWAHGLVDVETGMTCDFQPSALDAAVPTMLAVVALLCLSLGSPAHYDRVMLAFIAVTMSFIAVRRWFAFARDHAEHRAAVRRVADAWARHDAATTPRASAPCDAEAALTAEKIA